MIAVRFNFIPQRVVIRGLHSSTFQLNLSPFLSLILPTNTEYPTKRACGEPKWTSVSPARVLVVVSQDELLYVLTDRAATARGCG